MNIPIHYLESILILCAMFFPTGLGSNIGVLLNKYRSRSLTHSLLGMLIAYSVLIAILEVSYASYLKTSFTIKLLYFIYVVVCMIICYFTELLIGVGEFYLKRRQLPKRVIVHNAYSQYRHVGVIDYIAVIAYVIMEEIVLRTVMFNLFRSLGIESYVVLILLIACVYAINHISFGITSCIQKFFSGIVLTMLYIVTEKSLIYPVIAHGAYNIFLLILSRQRRLK